MNRFFRCMVILLAIVFVSTSLFAKGAQEPKPTKAPVAEPTKEPAKTETTVTAAGGELQYVITDFEDSKMALRLYQGPNSKFTVELVTDDKYEGKQSAKVTATTTDWTGVEIVVGEGKGDWSVMRTVKMWVKGMNSGTEVKVVIEDSKKEQFTQSFFDSFSGWKQVNLPVVGFKSRTDWQDTTATVDGIKDYPIKFLHFFTANGGDTVMYFDLIIVTDEGKKKDPNEKEVFVEKIVPAYKLKDLAASYDLLVGAAATPSELKIDDLKTVLARDFNSLTPGNEMKFYTIKKDKDKYNFDPADEMAKFAADNKMKLRGHTLVWHNAMPEWLEKGTWTKDALLQLLKEYITTVVSRYKGKVYAWDVVNEPLADNGDLRKNESVWARVIGEEYIEKAFTWAHEADPDAKLFINDYNVEEVNPKSTALYNLVKKLKDKGIPIHGAGLQFHLMEENAPAFYKVYDNVKRFAELGMDVEFTEVDVRIKNPVTEEKLKHQAEIYGEIYNIALAFPQVTNVTTWGVGDGSTWVTTAFPGYGSPLLFDTNYNPKPAYNAVQVVLVAGPQTMKYAAPETGTGRHIFPAFKANKAAKVPVLDGTMSAGEWDAATVYPFTYNQLSATDQRLPATKADLDGNWRILYQGNTLYCAVQRVDEKTVTSVANSWENDTVEVYFGIDKDFVQLRTVVGKDFEGVSYKGAKKAVWSATGDVLEFSLVLPPADLEGKIIGWNIALADNDGGSTREHQVYPVNGNNVCYQGKDFTEIEFVKSGKAGERLGASHIVPPFRAVAVATAPVIDGKIAAGEWDKGVTYQFAFNQLSAKNLTGPAAYEDLYGDWKILWNGKTIYGLVQRKDDITNLSAANSWENDTVEVFFDLNGTFLQSRTLVGKEFEASSYKGARKAVWSAAGDVLEFMIELPADNLKDVLSGWNIALADNDGSSTREHQLYPIPGTNISYQGVDLAEIKFE